LVDPLQPLVGAGDPEGVRQEYTWYTPASAGGAGASQTPNSRDTAIIET
jgi:hypothetical protein